MRPRRAADDATRAKNLESIGSAMAVIPYWVPALTGREMNKLNRREMLATPRSIAPFRQRDRVTAGMGAVGISGAVEHRHWPTDRRPAHRTHHLCHKRGIQPQEISNR